MLSIMAWHYGWYYVLAVYFPHISHVFSDINVNDLFNNNASLIERFDELLLVINSDDFSGIGR